MNTTLVVLIITIVALVLLNQPKPVSDNPTQSEIQRLEAVRDVGGTAVETPILETDGLPYPQISHGFEKLSQGNLPYPLDNLHKLLPNGPSVLPIFRNKADEMVKKRMYLPDYYRKDTLPMNNIGSEEMRPFVTDSDAPSSAWTDENVSENPKFYSATMKPEKLTDIGAFFDHNNQYNDTTSPKTLALPSDNCYIDKTGGKFCLDNTRLQVIPPSLITDPKDCYSLNAIGMYKDYNRIPDDPNRVINGGDFYGSVRGSQPLGSNETNDRPLKDPVDSCVL
jgi:hypothetical protein